MAFPLFTFANYIIRDPENKIISYNLYVNIVNILLCGKGA